MSALFYPPEAGRAAAERPAHTYTAPSGVCVSPTRRAGSGQKQHHWHLELWQEVDIALGVQTGWSQKTFKSLRDRFVKLLTEETNSKRSGSATMNKTNWKYFTQLEFLRPSVEYRSTISSLSKNKRPSAEVEASEASCSSKGKRLKSPQHTKPLSEQFENFCKKQMDPTIPDRIGSFLLYLENEMRALPKQAATKLIRRITMSLIEAQDELAL
ncbi:uncharacterized protein [Temnothorax nylanderi]|uniref:uncharacterized protein n=1 Tax=Temnothorax nylanderi TaxID=102681 RepID=UPI003A87A9A3